MRDSAQTDAPTGIQLWRILLLLAIANVAVGLTGYSPIWGFNYWSILPTWFSITTLAILVILLFGRVSTSLGRYICSILCFRIDPDRSLKKFLIGLLITALALSVFLVLRSKALLYGDGYSHLELVAGNNDSLIFGQNKFQALSIFGLRSLVAATQQFLSLSPEFSFALVSAVGGVVGFWALVAITRLLEEDVTRVRALLVLTLTSGTTILFFGYIETYTWPLAVGLWSLYFTIYSAKHARHLTFAVILALIATALHALAFPFLVSALSSVTVRRLPRIRERKTLLFLLALLLIGSAGIIELMRAYWVPTMFVPLYPIEHSPYWSLSPSHLLDLLNLVLLLTPLSLVAAIELVRRSKRADSQSSPELVVIGLISILFLIEAFWIDPSLGAMRDWDLMSYFGFPLTILSAVYLLRRFTQDTNRMKFLGSAFVLFLVLIVPNLAEKHDPGIAAHRIDSVISGDIHYQIPGRYGDRCLPLGTLLSQSAGEYALAKRYLLRSLDSDSSSGNGGLALSRMYVERGFPDSAEIVLVHTLELHPYRYDLLNTLSGLRVQTGDIKGALAAARAAQRLAPNDGDVLTNLGNILWRLGNQTEALASFQSAYVQDTLNQRRINNLAFCYYQMNNYDSSFYYLGKLLSDQSSIDTNEDHFVAYAISAEKIGKREVALQILNQIKARNPQSKSARLIESALKSN